MLSQECLGCRTTQQKQAKFEALCKSVRAKLATQSTTAETQASQCYQLSWLILRFSRHLFTVCNASNLTSDSLPCGCTQGLACSTKCTLVRATALSNCMLTWLWLREQDYVMKLMVEQHQQYTENITAEAAKRRALMQYVQNLEVRHQAHLVRLCCCQECFLHTFATRC